MQELNIFEIPLFTLMKKTNGAKNFVDRLNNYWTAFYNFETWKKIGRPNDPHEDLSMAEYVRFHAGLTKYNKF